VPLNLPAGWSFERVFGETEPKVFDRDAKLETFKQLAVMRQPAQVDAVRARQVMLPQGGTLSTLLAILGSLFMGLALLLQIFTRRRQVA
jgi:Ca-activated chloride channel homolog